MSALAAVGVSLLCGLVGGAGFIIGAAVTAGLGAFVLLVIKKGLNAWEAS